MIARLVSVVCIAAALVTLGMVAAPLMPLAGRGYGSDWGFFFSYLLAGEQWGRLNGWLAPAYFTPAFCGGMPFLAIVRLNFEASMVLAGQYFFSPRTPSHKSAA